VGILRSYPGAPLSTVDESTVGTVRGSAYRAGRLLGHGASVRLSGLPEGRRHVTLVVRTADGRRASRTVAVEVVRRLR
jgi:hypothetical protein